MSTRLIPLINNRRLRTGMGFIFVIMSPIISSIILSNEFFNFKIVLPFLVLSWMSAVFLTDKYKHKYPQRYYTYLLASHSKAALIMAFLLLILCIFAGNSVIHFDIVWLGFIIYIFSDFLVSIPCKRYIITNKVHEDATLSIGEEQKNKNKNEIVQTRLEKINTQAIKKEISSVLKIGALTDFINEHLPKSKVGINKVIILDDIPGKEQVIGENKLGMIIGRLRLNDVKRLNLYLQYCAKHIVLGGYLVVCYTPLEAVTNDLKRRYKGILYWPAFLLHFLWYRALPKIPWIENIYFYPKLSWLDNIILRKTKWRSRILSKAEVWGRLAFYGIEVLAESGIENEKYILAKHTSPPVLNRKPSFYAIVGLEKVGLDGKIIRLHKVRSMYPFSEFLQKNIFETHGLTTTGKFKNDFRLTEYGKLIRRHWIDELPGLFDWLRGDIKLVGMRATSPHFLSLYPKELYDLYIQIKPGLVPPIFNESTDGFDQIVKIEFTYLKRYIESPIRTDILYFWYTFRDIFIHKVRSS